MLDKLTPHDGTGYTYETSAQCLTLLLWSLVWEILFTTYLLYVVALYVLIMKIRYSHSGEEITLLFDQNGFMNGPSVFETKISQIRKTQNTKIRHYTITKDAKQPQRDVKYSQGDTNDVLQPKEVILLHCNRVHVCTQASHMKGKVIL